MKRIFGDQSTTELLILVNRFGFIQINNERYDMPRLSQQ